MHYILLSGTIANSYHPQDHTAASLACTHGCIH